MSWERPGISIGIPVEDYEADPHTGAGRVWTKVLDSLQKRGVQPRPLDPKRKPRLAIPGRGRPDVWLSHGLRGPIEVCEPVVAVIHGAAWSIEDNFFEYVPRAYAEMLIRAVKATVAGAELLIVPSEYARRGVVRGCAVSADDVYPVPHGVDSEVFKPDRTGGRDLVSNKLGEPWPYVLFASIPAIQQKNLAALKQAMSALARRGAPHALVIAGGLAGGESPEELAAISHEPPGMEGRVLWLGHVSDEHLAGLMAECAAFCLPSMFESFGLTALEAMACGAPVVVSNRGALPEVVGDAALQVEPTAEELESALDRVLGDDTLASRLRRAGRARAERMTWDRTADGWLDVLRLAADARAST
jgi:glycosyltransferase involved in cell wall biosynthesis